MWLKCYTRYASKFGKVSSGHRTRKGQFLFQWQRRAMPKNVHLLISRTNKAILKIRQARLQRYVIQKFQMYKLDLEKAKEPEIKLPTFVGSLEKQKNSTRTSIAH